MILLIKLEEVHLILKFKFVLIFLFFTSNLAALEVIITKNKISYNSILSIKDLSLKNVLKVKRSCKPLTLNDLDKRKYITKHYIKKGNIICLNNVKIYKKEVVVVKFGNIEIEKNGKIIFENDKYFTIKKRNGKLEKIYKDGSLK